MEKPTGYYDGVNRKLYDALPKNIPRVLELGCANGRLGELYKSQNSATYWAGIDFAADALEQASLHLDRVDRIDLNNLQTNSFQDYADFDVIVIGEALSNDV